MRRDAAWWIPDAATEIASGRMTIAQMGEGQPWPDARPAAPSGSDPDLRVAPT